MARNRSLKLDPLFPVAWSAAGAGRQKQALKRYGVVMARNELIGQLIEPGSVLADECIKLGWRGKRYRKDQSLCLWKIAPYDAAGWPVKHFVEPPTN